jgi:hypothetical protein
MAESYCTLDEVKASLDESETTDDALIEQSIAAASRAIEQTTNRLYYATTATRYYRGSSLSGALLFLDGDLLSVSTLTNANGLAITSGYYILLPRNQGPPYTAIELKSTKSWAFTSSDSEISVAGSWGNAATPPENVRQACVFIARQLYLRRLAPFGALGGNNVVHAVHIAENDPDIQLLLRGQSNYQGLY